MTSQAGTLIMKSKVIIVIKMIQEVIPEMFFNLDLSRAKDIFRSNTGITFHRDGR